MIAAKYWHRIGTRNWTFAAEERTKKNGEQSYFALEYATDTKIIRFKKIVSNANPFDERWSGYYEERDGEKMLNSTNGREKLLKVWRNQHRCCPVCNEPITSETSFKVHKVFRSGKSPWLEMVHPECHAVLHKNDSCFVEPGSDGSFMKGLSRMRGNSHVRFLGEGLAVMPSSYPIRPWKTSRSLFLRL